MDINPAEGVSRKLNIDFKQGGVLNTSPCFVTQFAILVDRTLRYGARLEPTR